MSASPDYLQAALALAFVLGLLLVAAAGLSRWRGKLPGVAGSGRIAVIETRGIDARSRLVLLRWDRTEHLVLVGQSGVQLIGTAPVPTPLAAEIG